MVLPGAADTPKDILCIRGGSADILYHRDDYDITGTFEGQPLHLFDKFICTNIFFWGDALFIPRITLALTPPQTSTAPRLSTDPQSTPGSKAGISSMEMHSVHIMRRAPLLHAGVAGIG